MGSDEKGKSSMYFGQGCRNRSTKAMLFFLVLLRIDGAVFTAADLATSERQLLVCSVCVWEEGTAVSQSGFGAWRRCIALLIILSFSLFLSVSVHSAHVLDSRIAPRPFSSVLIDCAFFGFRILTDFVHYADALTTRLFASFFLAFLRFLVSSHI